MTARAADEGARLFVRHTLNGVAGLIGLVGKTGDAFGRLSPQVANVTCVFLLTAFFLVASFFLLHRSQTIQLEQNVRDFNRQVDEAKAQHGVCSLAPRAPA